MAELKVTAKLKSNVLNQVAGRALSAYAKELDPVLDRQFTDDKWGWPRVTRRRSGEIAGSPRNVIDSGDLLGSKTFTASPNKRRWVWDTPYASLVKNGYITSTGASVPARDWIKAALKELPFPNFIANYLKR